MSNTVSSNVNTQADFETFSKGYDVGAFEERERIIEYLINKGVLRMSMFGDSLVAGLIHPDGEYEVIDLPATLKE
jgi:hypothetical protein